MQLLFGATAADLEIVDAGDLTSLSVSGVRPSEGEEPAYADIGIHVTDDGCHVYVSTATISGLVPEATRSPDWKRRFDAMVTYAASKGWTDDSGNLRAHAEWVG